MMSSMRSGSRKPIDMNRLFKPNISGKGRLIRGVLAALLILAAMLAFSLPTIARVALGASGAFVAFEALRGWCALRACGVKTRF